MQDHSNYCSKQQEGITRHQQTFYYLKRSLGTVHGNKSRT